MLNMLLADFFDLRDEWESIGTTRVDLVDDSSSLSFLGLLNVLLSSLLNCPFRSSFVLSGPFCLAYFLKLLIDVFGYCVASVNVFNGEFFETGEY